MIVYVINYTPWDNAKWPDCGGLGTRSNVLKNVAHGDFWRKRKVYPYPGSSTIARAYRSLIVMGFVQRTWTANGSTFIENVLAHRKSRERQRM